jgi:hypothetical protein
MHSEDVKRIKKLIRNHNIKKNGKKASIGLVILIGIVSIWAVVTKLIKRKG